MGAGETGDEVGGAPSHTTLGRQPLPRALSVKLPRRILARVETLERRFGQPVPAELSAAARAQLNAVLASLKEPLPERREDGDDCP